MTEKPSPIGKSPAKRFCVGFVLGAVPGFMYGFLYALPLDAICFIGVGLGLTCGALAALFGQWMLDLLIVFFKSGWS